MTWAPIDCLISLISTLPSTLGSIHTGQAHTRPAVEPSHWLLPLPKRSSPGAMADSLYSSSMLKFSY